MRIIALLLVIFSAVNAATAQEAVHFYSSDSNKVNGDLYRRNNQYPFILLCPQEGSDRREYLELAPRLLNLEYNCLAVDLRQNSNPADAMNDICASIKYVQQLNSQPVILMGSSVSASLCLILAADNPRIKAVIALNPGEYLQPRKYLCNEVAKISQSVIAFATLQEYPYIQKMLSPIPAEHLTLFKPETNTGMRGTKAFYATSQGNDEYWFALTLFFKKLKH
jgi:pimeloyl-ACP methyl ester carboxylesterase